MFVWDVYLRMHRCLVEASAHSQISVYSMDKHLAAQRHLETAFIKWEVLKAQLWTGMADISPWGAVMAVNIFWDNTSSLYVHREWNIPIFFQWETKAQSCFFFFKGVYIKTEKINPHYLESLRWSLSCLSEQPVLVFPHPHCNFFFLISNWNWISSNLKPIPLFLSLHLLLGLPHPIFTHLTSVPILFPGYLFLLHCLCISFLPFSFSSRSWLSCDGLLPSFSDFLYLGIESSYALWKMSFKISWVSSAPLPLRAVFHRGSVD